MRSRRRRPTEDVIQPGPDQKQVYPRDVKAEDLQSMETINERENELADDANVEELEETSRDYWGRSAQETDGAVPSDLPDREPIPFGKVRKPKGPPKHNM